MAPRSTALSITLILVTIVAGLVIRFAPLGLRPVVVKYGGSTLWALMIYWIISALLPLWRVSMAALLAGAVATAVEFFKLYDTAWLHAFRLTLPGILLLGRFFSVRDIAVYWVAIGIGAFVDISIRKHLPKPKS